MSDSATTSPYVLGTAEAEHDRLMRQAALLAPYTERLFRDAGMGPGQRVLDIGSGMGDVALLAAQVVGPHGQVLGIDLDHAALARARQRAEAHDLRNLTFVQTDLAQFTAENSFDAIVGRLTLQFVPQPIDTLSTLARSLCPGGVMVFQESNWEALLSQVSHLSLRRTCCELIYESFKRSNANVNMGSVFLRGFQQIGFANPRMCLDVPIGVDSETRRWVYDLVCTLYPRFIEYGFAVSALGELATLSARLDSELTRHNSYAACIGLTGVWSRKPA
jgi:ubiquinone/menaquinone biosynthesis C-methylase UbiE